MKLCGFIEAPIAGRPTIERQLSMTSKHKRRYLILFIAAVWLVNGLFFKVLNLLPRHQEIVAHIFGEDLARPLSLVIGLAETVMAVWVLSGYRSGINAFVQIVAVASMNLIEFLLVPDLLLWGKLNAFFALLFICLVYYTEFVLGRSVQVQEKT